jgi:hypothetical protein
VPSTDIDTLLYSYYSSLFSLLVPVLVYREFQAILDTVRFLSFFLNTLYRIQREISWLYHFFKYQLHLNQLYQSRVEYAFDFAEYSKIYVAETDLESVRNSFFFVS